MGSLKTEERKNKRKKKRIQKKQILSKILKLEKKIIENPNLDETLIASNSINESESNKIDKLLEPYSKTQLIDLLSNAAINDSSLFRKIQTTADQDISHRKIFIHGLSGDTTRETLVSVFTSFGEIDDCKLVFDRNSGKSKGYGFIIFKSRVEAEKALKIPQKKIGNRVASCRLASAGSVVPTVHNQNDSSLRKIYVTNVHVDADPLKLRTFFMKFGELESGPLGFDMLTGKSRGFVLFVYKSYEGAKRALEEPFKIFEGHQLHCQKAFENKTSSSTSQNLTGFNQHPSLNLMYSGLGANLNYGLIPGSVNPLMAGSSNPGLIPPTQMGLLGRQSGILGGTPSILGAPLLIYPASNGLQSYPNSNVGQSSSSRIHGVTGSLTGYPSNLGFNSR